MFLNHVLAGQSIACEGLISTKHKLKQLGNNSDIVCWLSEGAVNMNDLWVLALTSLWDSSSIPPTSAQHANLLTDILICFALDEKVFKKYISSNQKCTVITMRHLPCLSDKKNKQISSLSSHIDTTVAWYCNFKEILTYFGKTVH